METYEIRISEDVHETIKQYIKNAAVVYLMDNNDETIDADTIDRDFKYSCMEVGSCVKLLYKTLSIEEHYDFKSGEALYKASKQMFIEAIKEIIETIHTEDE